MKRRIEGQRAESRRSYVVRNIPGTAFLWFFGSAILWGGLRRYSREGDIGESGFLVGISLILFSVPLFGYYLRRRPEEIRCPNNVTLDGRPAIHFPGDRRAVPVSAGLYALMAGTMLATEVPRMDEPGEVAWFIVIGALFFLSYTLFAVTGRFNEDGTFLHERGVTIRARGLRAELPWSSIAGSHTYKSRPWPYPRIAIHLHPGSHREVSTTVPWWIGSPRPRRDTVFLTKVQVPGSDGIIDRTNPGNWIDDFAQKPPTAADLEKLSEPPSHLRPSDRPRSERRHNA